MNCAEFDEIVHELDRLGQAGGGSGQSPASEAAIVHAESCSRCAKLLTEIEALNFGLRAIAQHDAEQQAPARLEASLLNAFREQAARQHIDGATPIARLRSYGWYAVALGAAAAVLFTLGLVRGWFGTGVRNPAPKPGAVAAIPAGTNKPLRIGNPVVEMGAHNPASASDAAIQSAQPAAGDEATAFYALPYADDSASLEGGAVIRVSVPQSALVAWGLPVSGVGGAGPVPADLLISADGTPQAIRLVSETNE